MLAAQLYDKGKLSLGQAADLIGMGKADFMNIIEKYGVSILGKILMQLKKDLLNA